MSSRSGHGGVLAAFAVVLAVAASATPVEALEPAEADTEASIVVPIPGPSRQSVFDPAQKLGHEVGALRIPAIDVDEKIRAGVDLSVIDQGVAHWVGTSGPGGPGNMVLAGHRTTHSAPFYDLDRLELGDMIFVTDGMGREVMYRVSDTFVVSPDEVWITYDDGRSLVTLFACHPKGSASRRIVVQAELAFGRAGIM